MIADSLPVNAVIVTRNRSSDLKTCLQAIRAQSRPPDGIIVVDNASTDATADFLQGESALRVLRSERNIGGAGGFEWGLRVAVNDGARWVWVMDDDAVPEAGCLERLLEAGATSQDRLGAIAPVVRYRGWLDTCGFRQRRANSGGVQRVLLEDVGCEPSPIDWAPFLGLLVSAEAVRDVGGIRGDLFIWGDDREYCLRLRVADWKILCVPTAAVAHPSGRPAITRRVLGRELTVGNPAPWQEYYGVRNLFLVDAWYARTPMGDGRLRVNRVLHGLRSHIRSSVITLLVDRENGFRRVFWQTRGLLDGLMGRTGIGPVP